ncbi:MAG: ABC transporter permease [Candidatus Heimdallarchaeaceae archaeon]
MLRSIQKKSRNFEGLSNKFIISLSIIALISFLLAFFYIPIVRIFQTALSSDSGSGFKVFWETLSDPFNLKFLGFTLLQAFLSTVLCLLIGLPIGYFFAKYEFKGKKLIINLLTIPFVLPPVIVLIGFTITYGQGGWVNLLWQNITNSSNVLITIDGTVQGIILAHVFYNLSVIIRLTIPAWQNIDNEQIEVSSTLGVGKGKTFQKIVFPQIKNAIISSSLLVFIYTFNSFAIVMKLGNFNFYTLEVLIYESFDLLKFSEGASLAVIQLVINSLVIILYLVVERKSRKMAEGKEKGLKTERLSFRGKDWKSIASLSLSIFFVFIVILFSFAPIIAIIVKSFIPKSPGDSPFWGYSQIFTQQKITPLNTNTIRLFGNTLLFATVAAVISLILSVLIVFVLRNRYQSIKKYQRSASDSLVSYLIILPMATSSITLGLGLYLSYSGLSSYYNSVWIFIIMSHVLISIPFVTRSILVAYNRIDVELLNVASSLGASRVMVFRKIEFPLIKRGIIVGGIFSFAISLGEFGATFLLARANYETLSIGIYNLLGSQTLQISTAMASVLILITALCFYLINKFGDIELKV